MKELRKTLEPLTDRLKLLPVDDRGYPVPWFVAWIDGKPEFRAADQEKWINAVQFQLCWVCGQKLGAHKTFVIGPMCGVNRITSEPPTHLDCAQWSARNCPFLANPNMVRNEHNMPEGTKNPGGVMIERNPGLTLLWSTKSFKPFKVANGALIRIGDPTSIEFYTKGRKATREEIDAAIEAGCPLLEQYAREDGGEALNDFYRAKHKFVELVGVYVR